MTDHVPAAAEGLPNITRRNVLLGLAGAAPVIAVSSTAVASEVGEQAENPALVAAWKKFRDAETEFYAAYEALEWLVDEWRHIMAAHVAPRPKERLLEWYRWRARNGPRRTSPSR